MKVFSSKNFSILLGLIILFSTILAGFIKVNQLENAKKEIAQVPSGTIQTISGVLQKVANNDYILGISNAPVTIIEYSDFECTQCQELHPILMKFLNDYKGKVRLITRMFPLPQNTNAEKEAEAVLCAGSIGGNTLFWEYGDKIFERTAGTEGGTGFPLNKLIPLAKELGIKEKQFASCLNSGKFASQVASQKKSGENAGVNSLPALFIIDPKGHTLFLSGDQSYPILQAVVDQSLALL